MTHPNEARPQPARHPLEDDVELYEQTEDVPGELDRTDLMDAFGERGLDEELAEFEAVDDSPGAVDEA